MALNQLRESGGGSAAEGGTGCVCWVWTRG